MNFQVLPQESYDALILRLDQMHKALTEKQKNPKEVIFDSAQLMSILNVKYS